MSFEQGRESLDRPSTPKAPVDHATEAPTHVVAGDLPTQNADTRAELDRILQSDIGVNTLLTRLKQSISSAREFSGFLKERAALEERHFNGIQRLTRSTHDVVGRPDSRQGSFAFNYREVGLIHDRMAKNSEDFAHNLLAMSEELQELATHAERGRKQWKHTGLDAEQRAQDADSAMEKAKQKYFSSAEQYDRVRTGERQGGKFGLKGPKSAAQQEESLLSKAESADQEYRTRVEAAQAQRHELMASSRPTAIRELQNYIMECDAAVSMQLQKFAVMNEKLLLANGLCISPLSSAEGSTGLGSRSLREIAQSINNQTDFEAFVLHHSDKVGLAPTEIRYEKHPALAPPQRHPGPPPSNSFQSPPRTNTNLSSMSGPAYNDGQTSGFVPADAAPPMKPAAYEPLHPQQTNPPQIPQIGALTLGGRNHLGSPIDPAQGRGDVTSRNVSSPVQPAKPGQPYEPSPTNHSLAATVNQQVTSHYRTAGTGAGRGQPTIGSGPAAHSEFAAPGSQNLGGRTSSLAQQSEYRPEGYDAQQQGPPHQARQPEPRGPPQISNAALHRQDVQAPQHSPVYQQYQTETRSPQNPTYQPYQHDPRGLPSQAYNAAHAGPVGPNNSSPSESRVQSGQMYGVQPSGPDGPSSAPTPTPAMFMSAAPAANREQSRRPANLPPRRPVFGVSLDELFRRDGAAVPTIVYQCVQAVDLHGTNVEGIYRVSGSAQVVTDLRALFDHDSSQVDLKNPATFYNDINAVTTLLKNFLRDLPDPLLTMAQYSQFIQAAQIPDDIVRRDSLHAIINSLPDPNYATLRTLVLHLHRIGQHHAQNRMTTSNLALMFGPTLMGGHGGRPSGGIQDAGWQHTVVETILNNTMQIFDDDE